MKVKSMLKRSVSSKYAGINIGICFATLGAVLTSATSAYALSIYDGSNSGNNLEINLTTTASWTGMFRVNSPSAILLTPQNGDGDSNFQHGMVADLFSIVPVLDIRDGDAGAHFSGQLYLNTSYLGTNQNDLQPYSSAIYTAKQTDFTSATRNVEGENAQLLDAFGYVGHTFDNGQSLQLKVGKSVLFWGQSLFFPNDGISGGQAPINLISAQNSINPQAQQVFMPVGQGIVTYTPVSGTTLQAYWQPDWEHDYFQAQGAYFNGANFIDRGGSFFGLQQIEAPLGPNGALAPVATVGVTRIKDEDPHSQLGQFGVSFQQEIGTWDLGIFVERFDAKTPELGLAPYASPTPISNANPKAGALSIGYYQVVYPSNIWLQGISGSTNIGPANVAGEISVRENDPLVPNTGAYTVVPGENAQDNNGYPVGTVWNAQVSSIYVTPAIPLDPGGVTILGEALLNHLINVTQNRAALVQGGQGTAGAFDVQLVPTYNEVLPNLQVTLPVSLTYDFLGNSDVDGQIYHGTGVFTAGVTGTYKTNWIASLSYQDYLGRPNIVRNNLADRGFVAINLQHSF